MANAQSSVELRLELLSKPTGTWGTKEVAEYFGVSNSKALSVIKDLPAPPVYETSRTKRAYIEDVLKLFGKNLNNEIIFLKKIGGRKKNEL